MHPEFDLYVHPKMQDVALEIISVDNSLPDKVKLEVHWWNIGSKHLPYPMQVWQELQVPHEWVSELQEYKSPFKPK